MLQPRGRRNGFVTGVRFQVLGAGGQAWAVPCVLSTVYRLLLCAYRLLPSAIPQPPSRLPSTVYRLLFSVAIDTSSDRA